MPAKASEQRAAGLQCFQQMKSSNRAPGTVRFLGIVGDHQRRPSPALHDSRGGDANHSAMPTLAVQHDAIGFRKRGLGLDPLFDLLHNAPLFLLAIYIELIQASRNLLSL